MTMALVKNDQVVQVGLPAELRPLPLPKLKQLGWRVVVGDRPADPLAPGYQWHYGEPWSVDGANVVGTWSQVQQPQPYPSWTWEEGTGWLPPVARPDDGNEYEWDEDSQSWVLSQDEGQEAT